MEPEVLSSSLRGGTTTNPDPSGARAVVIGAGAAGLCTALALQRAGVRCVVVDPAPLGANASGIAAGMIAPAFETALDAPGLGRFPLLRAGRDLWAKEGVALDRSGALWADADEAALDGIEAALAAEGASAQRLSRTEALRLRPELGENVVGAVHTPDDWRLEPLPALLALRAEFLQRGGVFVSEPAREITAGTVVTSGGTLEGEAVVVCAGYASSSWTAQCPELSVLTPIRGELARFPARAPLGGPTVRHAGGYLAPSAGGVIAGATMEEGVSHLRPGAAGPELAAGAAQVMPSLRGAAFESALGVRAATPDGLPLAGRSQSGVWLAVGFRRNGWTLAPLAARIVAAGVAGSDPGPWAGVLRPDRF